MTQEITMGSLFSGSGGFELAGSIFGIRPIWASEIEPFPILVTTKNFPEMKHLGDINKLNGADLEPVTIIAGGLVARGPGGVCHKMQMERSVATMTENMGSVGTYQKVSGPLMANSHPGSYTGQDAFSDMLVATEYIVRRLTPLECCRLQGFPDNWAEELGIPEPTQEDINHWREVFRTQIEAMGESKKEKTDNQICKWLKDPESDSAKYKMWGNGIALPCAMFVMEGIAMILSEEDADEQK